jgi:DNA gyrase subunit B
VVTALAEWLEVKVSREGRCYHQEYAWGVPCAPVSVVGEARSSGTRIRFRPNRQLLCGDLHYELLDERVRELAYLNSGLEITLRDERPGQRQEHRCCFDEGVVAFARYLNRHRRGTLLEPIRITGAMEGGELDAAIQYAAPAHNVEEITRAFAHNIETIHGGTHLNGFRAALRQALTAFGRAAGLVPEGRDPLSSAEVSRGLTAVISVHLDRPRFENSLRGRLGNTEVYREVERLIAEQLLAFLASHPSRAREIVKHCLAVPDHP